MYTMPKEKPIPYTFRILPSLFAKLQKKQSYINVPDKLRRLIERYVNDEIELEDEKNQHP